MPPKRLTTGVKGKVNKETNTVNAIPNNSKQSKSSYLITEQDILNAHSKQQLVGFINELTKSKQDEIFEEYKEKVTEQISHDAALIEQLNIELVRKQNIIDNLIEENLALKHSSQGLVLVPSADSNKSFESPIRRKQLSNMIKEDQLTKELEDIGTFLDLIELLTGVVLLNCFVQDSKYHFDIQQTSSNKQVEITYRLLVDTSFQESIDIEYIPLFMEEKPAKVKKLQSILPEYLCENLSFSLSTLGQFYSKVNKAINKKK